MKRILLCLALACSPLTVAAACATFEQVQPRSPRAALAEAEVLFIGVVETGQVLANHGYLSTAQVQAFVAAVVKASADLDQAHALLGAGEAAAAGKIADAVAIVLNNWAVQLATARDAGPIPATLPPAAVPSTEI